MRVFFLTGAGLLVLAAFACTDSGTTSPGGGSPGGPEGPGGGSSGTSGSSSGSTSSSGSSGTTPAESFVNVTKESFDFGGKTRTYYLAKPKTYDPNKSYPLVLSFHGNPGTADGMVSGLPFDSVSKSDAVIAYPQASTNDWDLYTPTAQNADMAFIAALPDEIATKANIDKAKILGFGYSGGAFFLTQFTCRFGGVFKAISINAGGGPDEAAMGYGQYPNGCWMCPGGPIATIVTHGASDTEVEPGSGDFTQACYATFNGCDEALSPVAPSPCQEHAGCAAGKPVKWCLIPGQSHAPWGDAMKEAWSFFNALP